MAKLPSKYLFSAAFIILILLNNSISLEQKGQIKPHQTPIKKEESSQNTKLNPDYGQIPLYFIPNKGQVDEKALFYAKTSQYTLWMTKEGLVFDSAKKMSEEEYFQSDSLKLMASGFEQPVNKSQVTGDRLQITDNRSQMIERDVSRLIFLNTNKNVGIIPEGMTPHRVNYFKDNDESKWRTNIQTSAAVLYKELYENIDLMVYGIERQIEYDWVVKSGGDVEKIRFEYRGMKETKIDGEGNLVIEQRFGELVHRRPESYQMIEGRKIEVDVEFKKVGENTYALSVEEYNRGYDLIIDPKVFFCSTYLGGTAGEYVRGIAVDNKGAAYVSGYTSSTDFPTKNAYQGNHAGVDVFVTKFSADGKSLIYSTYLGGSDSDMGRCITVDSSGAAYVSGDTRSTDYPTKSAYQGAYRGGDKDVFVTKLSSSGTRLIYSTYLGGSSTEDGIGIAVDDSGAAYAAGYTASYNFPTQNPYQGNHAGGLWDSFVTKFSADGQNLVYSTYLGGLFVDWLSGIAVDSTGAAYVTGRTSSKNFPVMNAYQDTYVDNFDVFITKFFTDGQNLVYSTYLGGSDFDYSEGIAVDNNGAAYVVGDTLSTDFPTMNAYQGTHAGGSLDAFVTMFSPDGKNLVYSTYLGGSDDDDSEGIAVDGSGAAYVTGYTKSTDFPTQNPYQGSHAGGTNDAFVTKFPANGQSLVYSTYLGGSGADPGYDIAVDSSGEAYVTGDTTSTDFPTKNAYQGANAGGRDAFVTKLNFSGNLPPEVKYFKINAGDKRTTDRMVTLDNTCAWNPTEYMAAENRQFTKNATSGICSSSLGYQLSPGYGKKKVYFKAKNDEGWSKTKKDIIRYNKPEKGIPEITYFGINNGAESTSKRKVTLNSDCTGNPTHYRVSEAEFVSLAEFKAKEWKSYKEAPNFSLSTDKEIKTVYFQVKNNEGESGIVCDQIYYGKPMSLLLNE